MTLIPALEQELIEAAQREFPPRRRLLPVWSTVGVGLAGLAAVITAAVLALTSGASPAFAGWTTTPSAATASTLSTIRAACGRVPAANVVASEVRGPFAAIVYLREASPWQCITRGSQVLLRKSTPYPPSAEVKPLAGRVSPPVIVHTVVGTAPNKSLNELNKRDETLFRGVGSESYEKKPGTDAKAREDRAAESAIILGPHSLAAVSGSVGPGVSGVTVVLRDGTRVKATVGHGWYLAWWPGTTDTEEKIPTAIRVTAGGKTVTAVYARSYLSKIYRPCLVNQTCTGGPWTIKIVKSMPPAFPQHFTLFRNTAPTPANSAKVRERRFGSLVLFNFVGQMGLDESQARKVSFGNLGTIWVVPGTEGACVHLDTWTKIGGPSEGAAGCNSLSETLGKGALVTETQSVFGLVADGNRTVSVCLTSGRHITLPVKDNVFYGILPGRISTVYMRNAFDKPVRQVAWTSKRCNPTN